MKFGEILGDGDGIGVGHCRAEQGHIDRLLGGDGARFGWIFGMRYIPFGFVAERMDKLRN